MTSPDASAAPPIVSVVIPSHNRPDLVSNAVQSVLDQQGPVDVIVVDDGSTPPVAAVGPLADQAVRIIRNDHAQGPSRARNRGLDAVQGDYVGLLDDDDQWLPGKLTKCLAALDEHPDAGVAAHRTAYASPTAAGSQTEPRLLTNPLQYFGTHQTPHPDSLLMRRTIADKVRFSDDLAAAEDVDYAIELGRQAAFVQIEDVLAVHGPDDVPSAIGLEKRIAARKQLRIRHPDVLYADRASKSFFHVRLGHLLRNVSRTQALGSFGRALWYQPASPLAWRGVFATLLPHGFASRLSKQRRTRDTEQ